MSGEMFKGSPLNVYVSSRGVCFVVTEIIIIILILAGDVLFIFHTKPRHGEEERQSPGSV